MHFIRNPEIMLYNLHCCVASCLGGIAIPQANTNGLKSVQFVHEQAPMRHAP